MLQRYKNEISFSTIHVLYPTTRIFDLFANIDMTY